MTNVSKIQLSSTSEVKMDEGNDVTVTAGEQYSFFSMSKNYSIISESSK